MLRAVIDLGTNTFNLLIADSKEGKLQIIHSEKEPVLLGFGGIHHGLITEEAFERALDTLGRFKLRCESYNIQSITGFGTSAIRGAKNAKLLLDEAKKRHNIDIRVITGEQEARLIYHGVHWSYEYENDAIIMDIGGGSTEFVHASSEGFHNMTSLDIGVLRIFHHLGEPTNFGEADYETIYDYLNKKEDDFFLNNPAKILIGASGSFETLYELIYKSRFNKPTTAQQLNIKELNKAIDWVLASTLEDRLNNEWIIPIRKVMLPIAVLKIRWVLSKVDAKEVWVSPYSLKEGAFTFLDQEL